MMSKPKRVIGAVLVIAALAVGGVTAYHNSSARYTPAAFSKSEMLAALWSKYRVEYIEPASGRVLDKQQQNITTSEGQSYAMLRAVWQDDRPTFDRVWRFTREQLRRPDDHLFSWKFGQRSDGSYGVLVDQGGQNTASDADSDIALSLVMAYGRWQQSSYLQQAKPIISDIWSKEVVTVRGRPLLVADNQEQGQHQVLVNPSYLAPYAYRAFANVDTSHDWTSLVASSYDFIDQTVTQSLDRPTSAGLPPNWVRVDTSTGAFTPSAAPLTTDFGYDALRLPWRLALDDRWNDEPRAAKVLQHMSFLRDAWRRSGSLAATYAHDGANPAGYESAVMYGGTIGYFLTADQADAAAVYDAKLKSLYDPDTQAWRSPLSYYDDNWAWFGIGLYQGALPDLAHGVGA